jgi:IS30 family transposase
LTDKGHEVVARDPLEALVRAVGLVSRWSKTQLTKIIKLPRATARATQKAAVRRLRPIGDFVHTITFDNGKEFAAHQDIASVNAAPTLATPK